MPAMLVRVSPAAAVPVAATPLLDFTAPDRPLAGDAPACEMAIGGFPRDALAGALLADLGVELVPPVFVRDNPVQMRVVELAHLLDTSHD